MICPRCGARNPSGQKFCGECGTPPLSDESVIPGHVVVKKEPALAKIGFLIAGVTLTPCLLPIIGLLLLMLIFAGVMFVSNVREEITVLSNPVYAKFSKIAEETYTSSTYWPSAKSYRGRLITLYDDADSVMQTILREQAPNTLEAEIENWTMNSPELTPEGFAVLLGTESAMRKAGVIREEKFDETKLRELLADKGYDVSLVNKFIVTYQKWKSAPLPDWGK